LTVEIIFETHSTSTDNEAGVASGWRDPPLSATGREQAKELGARRSDGIDAVFCSDLRRAVETAEIAFPGTEAHEDSRLREYDYGDLTGAPAKQIHAERTVRVTAPFPGGESLADVSRRVQAFLEDIARDWDGKRVVVIGHSATKLALDHLLGGKSLKDAAAEPFEWQPGWRYRLEPGSSRPLGPSER
jgi:broad specificity phosphatase PhoE